MDQLHHLGLFAYFIQGGGLVHSIRYVMMYKWKFVQTRSLVAARVELFFAALSPQCLLSSFCTTETQGGRRPFQAHDLLTRAFELLISLH